jgi:anaerobic ribonucleoside-triphosphate reductase activating protein
MIYYHKISVEENEILYGPGKRLVLWTQGCSIKCRGCNNKHLWSVKGAKTISEELFLDNFFSLDGIDGITLLGGEPTDQINSLFIVIKEIRSRGYSVILFTGHEIEDFKSVFEQTFIAFCDLIICGPFMIDKVDLYLHFRGSTNQRIIKNSSRFKDYIILDGNNIVLLDIQKDGIITNKGFPDNDIIEEIIKYQ